MIPATKPQTYWVSKPTSYETLEPASVAHNPAAFAGANHQGDTALKRSLNTVTVGGEARRGISKSTLRSDVRSINEQLATLKKPGQYCRAPGTRSVRRSRPTISQTSQSTALQKNAKIRRNQTAANIRKVQLKKTIQPQQTAATQ